MIEDLKKELETAFPEYNFFFAKRVYGKTIVAQKSKYVGADIFIKKDVLKVMPGIPKNKTRILIGGGAAVLMFFKKDYHEVSNKIFDYLNLQNINVKLVR